jgi:hypothetical protein
MIKPTCDEVHQALKDSIELRWKRLLNVANILDVPGCQLCEIFQDKNEDEINPCAGCPLSLIGEQCVNWDILRVRNNSNSAWGKWYIYENKQSAQNMINKLQFCLDKYFPKGWDK